MKKHKVVFFAAVLAAVLVLPNISAMPSATVTPNTSFVDAVIMFNPSANIDLQNFDIIREYDSLNGIAARIPLPFYRILEKSWFVSAIQIDHDVTIFQDTLDWGVDDVEAERVWGGIENAADVVSGNVDGTGVKVAILDTGIDYNHPDLNDIYAGGYDFVQNDNDPKDENGHGTHCAGIVAAEDNGEGVIGVAPHASVYAVRVLDAQGSGSISDIVAGIDWAIDNNMDVISMSLGASSGDSTLESAVNRAYNAGLVVVAASGNDGHNGISYPAAYSNAIAVGATDSSHNLASFSNYGAEQEVVAPGVDIYSTMPTYRVTLNSWWYGGLSQDYSEMDGTSMACPMVAGVVALILDADPTLTPSEVRDILHTTSVDLGSTGWDSTFGYGLVDAEMAVEEADSGGTPSDENPTVTIEDPTNGETVSDTKRVYISASDDNGVSKVELNIDSGTWIDITNNFDGTYYYYDWDTTQESDGSHNINARATDTASQTDTDSISVTVNNGGTITDTMHVASIAMSYEEVRWWFWVIGYDVYTEITVHDGNGNPLEGVTVYLEMTLPDGSTATGNADTGTDGTVTFVLEQGDSGTYTSTVTDLQKTGYSYVSSDNVETSESLTI
ncbi:MAG: S8 family serine peptidase [Candidatus Lokiarchaeota archaeon]|nr:S8 family serine peptidase [Candidatus Lokiarchaeota archaeon]